MINMNMNLKIVFKFYRIPSAPTNKKLKKLANISSFPSIYVLKEALLSRKLQLLKVRNFLKAKVFCWYSDFL